MTCSLCSAAIVHELPQTDESRLCPGTALVLDAHGGHPHVAIPIDQIDGGLVRADAHLCDLRLKAPTQSGGHAHSGLDLCSKKRVAGTPPPARSPLLAVLSMLPPGGATSLCSCSRTSHRSTTPSRAPPGRTALPASSSRRHRMLVAALMFLLRAPCSGIRSTAQHTGVLAFHFSSIHSCNANCWSSRLAAFSSGLCCCRRRAGRPGATSWSLRLSGAAVRRAFACLSISASEISPGQPPR